MTTLNPAMQKLTAAQLLNTMRLHQNIQKAVGPRHRDFDKHGIAIREVCAEMARRCAAGDAEVLKVTP